MAADPFRSSRRPDPWANHPPALDGTPHVYKSTDADDLLLWVYQPDASRFQGLRPGIVFFFGGGWLQGTPAQFEAQCRHLASLGMVAATADYRVLLRHMVPARVGAGDARSAIRYLRANAQVFGLDPDRLAAGGGSAGGHLAACTALIGDFDDPGDDATVAAEPDALVLFNPALVLAPLDGAALDGAAPDGAAPDGAALDGAAPDGAAPDGAALDGAASRGVAVQMAWRMGTEPERLSPAHHVAAGLPPTLIQHGEADSVVPFRTAEVFRDRMHAFGNRCELEAYAGQGHGFFNAANSAEHHAATTRRMVDFLSSLGWLDQPAAP